MPKFLIDVILDNIEVEATSRADAMRKIIDRISGDFVPFISRINATLAGKEKKEFSETGEPLPPAAIFPKFDDFWKSLREDLRENTKVINWSKAEFPLLGIVVKLAEQFGVSNPGDFLPKDLYNEAAQRIAAQKDLK